MTAPLDILSLTLADTQLIEASAGTGKTHTIANLYVRLIAETDRPVDAILVLTFTTAATAELRERIRLRLRQVAEALRTGVLSDADGFTAELMTRLADGPLARQRLETALANFDRAAVHTIHGFCQRLLGEHALASGAPFDAELVPDESELLAQIGRDFWRREIYTASSLFVDYVRDKAATPEELLESVRTHVNKPFLEIHGGEAAQGCAHEEEAYRTAFRAAAAVWQDGRETVRTILLDSPALSRSTYRKATVASWLSVFDQVLNGGAEPTLALPEGLEKCTPELLRKGTKKDHRTPEHSFFECCAVLRRRATDLRACFDVQWANLRRRLLAYCNTELARRKQRQGLLSYDDLLNQVAAALQGRNAASLTAAVRGQYSAALIDEFQDTDPVQYRIFERLYGGSGLPLFLVGDPKQAIYSFRGADVYAYLSARRHARGSHTLAVNWRSEPTLIAAVNAIFAHAPRPFLLDDIHSTPATPAPTRRKELLIEGQREPPFILWYMSRGGENKPMNKDAATAQAEEATAGEIARLLELGRRGAARFVDAEDDDKSTSLSGGDVAVLVRTHRQGRRIKAALAARGIHSVELADDSVFLSEEALELTRLLRALESPGEDALVRTALTTAMLGVGGEDLHRLAEDERAWEQWLLRFSEYHDLWRDSGFLVMFRRLLEREGVPRRLLALHDGERRMTNLLHLTELLQAEAAGGRQGMSELVDWLVRQRHETGTQAEEAQLRLESDEQLVQIVTVHRSKGLEYPVVFCPFAWDERTRENRSDLPVLFHDPANNNAPTLQLEGSDAQAQTQAAFEARAESLRLFYVALTRARNRCYLLWGSVNGAERSAPAWLLHRSGHVGATDDQFFSWLKTAEDAALLADLHDLQAQAPAAIRVEDAPRTIVSDDTRVEAAVCVLSARRFSGHIAPPWRMLSYTGLLRQGSVDRPDHDAYTALRTAEVAESRPDVFGFPRGAHAGSCLHAIFEHIDFSARNTVSWRATVERELERHGVEPQWTETILRLVHDVGATALDGESLRLADVGLGQRVNEWEFHYPLKRFARREIDRLFAPHDPQCWQRRQIEELNFDPATGYMKGYIDLVFTRGERWYIVDYKSNWLGAQMQDYAAERLPSVMAEEGYGLQYLIYSLALHRYLGHRFRGYDYAKHFGGVFYLFVRGMMPEHGPAFGVFHDRPPAPLIAELDRYVAGATA